MFACVLLNVPLGAVFFGLVAVLTVFMTAPVAHADYHTETLRITSGIPEMPGGIEAATFSKSGMIVIATYDSGSRGHTKDDDNRYV